MLQKMRMAKQRYGLNQDSNTHTKKRTMKELGLRLMLIM
jgi:hypothetical protein